MNADEFPEDSDSSDEDYVPDSKVEEAPSEEESDGDQEDLLSGSDSEAKSKGKKRSKTGKSKKKKVKKAVSTEEPTTNVESQITVDPEEQKKQADDIWADFIKDTGFKSKSGKADCSNQPNKKLEPSNRPTPTLSKNQHNNEADKKIKVKQIFEFAGEKVEVEKEVSASSAEARLLPSSHSKVPNRKSGGLSGIGGVLSQIGKKQKISTLEKSKLDWDRFKKEENIEEELHTYNKGKDGYLDRQDFLERADLRRFEIEKEIRNVERAKRFNSTA